MKVSTVDTRFIVDEAKKTVVCICKFKFKQQLFKASKIEPFELKATAHCHENDIFDAEIGKKVARAKVENKAYWYCGTLSKIYLKYLRDGVKRYEDFMKKSEKCILHNLDYIKRITK